MTTLLIYFALEDFKETIARAGNIEKADIMKEATVLAGNDAAGGLYYSDLLLHKIGYRYRVSGVKPST